MVAIAEKTRKSLSPDKKIPAALIYEEWNGTPIYYRNYKQVVSGKKTIEEIMSCSDLQGVLVALINIFLGMSINRKKYLIATNEVGLHISKNDNLGNDVVIFEKEKMGKLKGKFFDIAPKIVIEVDVKADVSDFLNKDISYIIQKSQKMLDFGTEKVVWVVTDSQKVFVINKDEAKWYVVDWSEDIQIVDDCVLNIKQLLDDDEIQY